MDNKTVLLDFELTEEQIQMLNIHSSLKAANIFDDIKYKLKDNPDLCDKIQVWFDCGYNDNFYDVHVVYADLIKDDRIVMKWRLSNWVDIEVKECPFNQERMMSYTITTKMI